MILIGLSEISWARIFYFRNRNITNEHAPSDTFTYALQRNVVKIGFNKPATTIYSHTVAVCFGEQFQSKTNYGCNCVNWFDVHVVSNFEMLKYFFWVFL